MIYLIISQAELEIRNVWHRLTPRAEVHADDWTFLSIPILKATVTFKAKSNIILTKSDYKNNKSKLTKSIWILKTDGLKMFRRLRSVCKGEEKNVSQFCKLHKH